MREASGTQLVALANLALPSEGGGNAAAKKCALDEIDSQKLAKLYGPEHGQPQLSNYESEDLLNFYNGLKESLKHQGAELNKALSSCTGEKSNEKSACPELRAALVAAVSADYSLAFRFSGWTKDHAKAKVLMALPCRLLGTTVDDGSMAKLGASTKVGNVQGATKTAKDAAQTVFSMTLPLMNTGMKLMKTGATDVLKMIPALDSKGMDTNIFGLLTLNMKGIIGTSFAAAGLALNVAKNIFEFRQKESALYTTRYTTARNMGIFAEAIDGDRDLAVLFHCTQAALMRDLVRDLAKKLPSNGQHGDTSTAIKNAASAIALASDGKSQPIFLKWLNDNADLLNVAASSYLVQTRNFFDLTISRLDALLTPGGRCVNPTYNGKEVRVDPFDEKEDVNKLMTEPSKVLLNDAIEMDSARVAMVKTRLLSPVRPAAFYFEPELDAEAANRLREERQSCTATATLGSSVTDKTIRGCWTRTKISTPAKAGFKGSAFKNGKPQTVIVIGGEEGQPPVSFLLSTTKKTEIKKEPSFDGYDLLSEGEKYTIGGNAPPAIFMGQGIAPCFELLKDNPALAISVADACDTHVVNDLQCMCLAGRMQLQNGISTTPQQRINSAPVTQLSSTVQDGATARPIEAAAAARISAPLGLKKKKESGDHLSCSCPLRLALTSAVRSGTQSS